MHKIRNHLPTQARLQIYHSFIQSHLNFCSLVWGFAAKTYIDSVFSKQKAGIRAVMEGYINFKYRKGEIPTHTKPFFTKNHILTVPSIIAKNSLIFMHKINNFPRSFPKSILTLIPSDAPIPGSNIENSANWLEKYEFSCPQYRKSIVNKGPLLWMNPINQDIIDHASLLSIKAYKKSVNSLILSLQSNGGSEDWPNFLLFNIDGLRKSDRLKNKN